MIDYIMILKSLYFMLPAYFANMAPVLTKDLFVKLAVPINEKMFGSHKTYRGLVMAVVLSVIIVLIQKWIGWNSIVDYSSVNVFLLGVLLGLGAMFGDLVKSYFKRKIGIKPGEPWYVIDQLDFPLGAMMFASFVAKFTMQEFFIIIVGSFGLTMIVNHIGYWLGVREVRW